MRKNFVFTILLVLMTLYPGRLMAKTTQIKSYGGIEEYRLDNGLKILLKANPDAPLVSFQVWYRAGSRNEKSSYTGLAHFLEHMMFKGTKQFRKGEIAQAIELKGGVFNAFTSDDYTGYYEDFAPEHLELAIKIESDRMCNAQLKQEELQLERSVVISELEGRANSPHSQLYESLKATAFDAHPYRNPIIGWIDDLHNIDSKVMREFYDVFYHPDNAVIILVGNFEKELALKMIDKYFGIYKASSKTKDPVSKEPQQKAFKKIEIKQEGFSKLLGMAFHIPEFAHPDFPALQLLADIGFGGTSSRLYKALVDAGLAISVSGYAESNIDPSVFRIIANLNPDADISKVQSIIETELESMKTTVTEAELKRAKARAEASSIYERDGIHEMAMQIAFFEVVAKDWTKYVDWLDILAKVSLDDIKRVAAKYLVRNNETVACYLPESPPKSLIEDNEAALIHSGAPRTYASGAASVERINPKQMQRLLDLSKPKYSKGYGDKLKQRENKIKSFSLYDGGPQLIFKEDHNLPLVYVTITVFAGSLTDAEQIGRAYLTANMLERGTAKHDKFELSELLDLYGADFNFSVDREYAEINISSLSKNLDKSLELFSEVLLSPKFSEEELAKLKLELASTLKQEDEYPARVASRELSRLIYPVGHPYYSYSVAEKLAALDNINIEQIKTFYAAKYKPSNVLVAVVGDITEGEVKAKLGPIFRNLNPQAVSSLEKPEIASVSPNPAKELVIKMPQKEQVEVILGHSSEISRNHPDFYATLLANYSLGGRALSSKLGLVVRDEHGLVYGIKSNFKASLGPGAFQITLGANPANVEKAIKLTKEEVTKFIVEGVSPTDLEANKLYLTGSFAARNLASNESLVSVLSGMQLYKLGLDYIAKYPELINSLTVNDVNAALRKHIRPESLHTVIVGP